MNKLLLIGWDGADWRMIHPLVDAGKMPTMAKLIDEGAIGNLATIQPALSPMVWTSISTGKRPFKHQVCGFSEPDPVTGGIRPVTCLSRKTKAVWNILNQNGKKSIVVGWWPSHPAEPIDGVMVSNHYPRATGPSFEEWPLQPGVVHPKRLEPVLKELRLHPTEIEFSHIEPFVPTWRDVDQDKDRRLVSLAKIVSDCTTVHSATTALMQNEEWDFLAVYYDALDHFGHGFMRYQAPRHRSISEEDHRLYRDVVEGGYRYHDMMLATLLALAGDDTTVVIVSDHGFHTRHLLPAAVPAEPAGPAAEHRQFGIFLAKGPGIRQDQLVYGASVLDVCPTLLTLSGLPVGEDMDGRTLTTIFEREPEVQQIPSWDDVPGHAGTHPPDQQIELADAKSALDQLVALGYIEEPNENQAEAVEETERDWRYNLAQSYMDAGRFGDAEQILLELYDRWPLEHRLGIKLANCYRATGRVAELRPLLDLIHERVESDAEQARQELHELGYHEGGEPTPPSTPQERRKLRLLRRRAHPQQLALQMLRAHAALEDRDHTQALAELQIDEVDDSDAFQVFLLRGEIHVRRRAWDDAIDAYSKALAVNAESPAAKLGLARAYLGQRNYPRVVRAALDSIGLLYFQPRAHFILGMACFRQGELEAAEYAFSTAARQNPTYPAAYRMLSEIYRRRDDTARAATYRTRAVMARQRLREFAEERERSAGAPPTQAENRPEAPIDLSQLPTLAADTKSLTSVPPDEIVTIVSGLPRSGTSMMMQMLEAGGLPILADGERTADESNPRGYHEFERAKRLMQDRTWLPEARGKVVKIVAQLLPLLPGADRDAKPFAYRVIFMERDLREIIASQARMLMRQGKQAPGDQGSDLSHVFYQQLSIVRTWLNDHAVPSLAVSYHDAVKDPQATAKQINAFLGDTLKEDAMAAAVASDLHRERVAEEG